MGTTILAASTDYGNNYFGGNTDYAGTPIIGGKH